jgi:hypothetical protein
MNLVGLLLTPQIDLTLFALVLASVRIYSFRRQTNSIWLLLAAVLTLTLGLAAAMNAAAQLILVAVNHYLKNAAYDFNVYSVMLIGGATVWLGWKLVSVSGCVARGDRQAWRKSAHHTTALLLVVSPMVPFQPMAYAAVALGFINLAGLEMARSVLSSSERACEERVRPRQNTWTHVRA